jgi:hypothetical protein
MDDKAYNVTEDANASMARHPRFGAHSTSNRALLPGAIEAALFAPFRGPFVRFGRVAAQQRPEIKTKLPCKACILLQYAAPSLLLACRKNPKTMDVLFVRRISNWSDRGRQSADVCSGTRALVLNSMPTRPLLPNEQTRMDGPPLGKSFFGVSTSGSSAVMYPAFVRGTLTPGPGEVRGRVPNHSIVL